VKLSELQIMISVLRDEVGWTWPFFLLKCLISSGSMFRRSHWAREEGAESEYAKALFVSVAMYEALIRRTGKDRAFGAMRKMLIPLSVNTMQEARGVSDKAGMERLLAAWASLDTEGMGQLQQGSAIRQDSNMLHYRVTSCWFVDFYQQAGVPELARLLCESDRVYWPQAAPDFRFHRGDSWENTIAYGKDHCEFIFESQQET
jgi:hypothetical protein